MVDENTEKRPKSQRGFALLSPERVREIARRGGKSVPNLKRSFSQNRQLAAEAGRKGGLSVPDAKRSFSQNRELAIAAGRKGGTRVPNDKRSFAKNPRLTADAGEMLSPSTRVSD